MQCPNCYAQLQEYDPTCDIEVYCNYCGETSVITEPIPKQTTHERLLDRLQLPTPIEVVEHFVIQRKYDNKYLRIVNPRGDRLYYWYPHIEDATKLLNMESVEIVIDDLLEKNVRVLKV